MNVSMVMKQAVGSQSQWGNICGDVTEPHCVLLAASPFSLLLVVKSCQSTVSNSSLLWNQKWVREYFDYSQLVLARWNFTASAKCLKDKTRNFLY